MTATLEERITLAVRYKGEGFSILPLQTDKRDPLDGIKWEQSTKSDPAVFLKNEGTQGYGLMPPSDSFIWDDDEGTPALLKEKAKTLGPLPKTRTHRSPHGLHLIYRWPTHLPRPKGPMWGTVITRWSMDSEGRGYVVGPGCTVFQQGKDDERGWYSVVLDVPIADLPEAWALDALAHSGTKAHTNGASGPAIIRIDEGYVLPAPGFSGSRYYAIRDYVAHLWNKGVSRDERWALVLTILAPRFASPLSEAELKERWKRADDERELRNSLGSPVYEQRQRTKQESEEQQQQRQEEQKTVIQTLETLPYGTPPQPLVLDTFIAPEGWTVFYATGGTGKGLIALWMMRHVMSEWRSRGLDLRIAVLDYEAHQWEWGNRARNLGWSQSERERVLYIDPYDPAWKKGHTLAGIAPELRKHGDDLGIGLYVVDSLTTAAGGDTDMGGANGAIEFFKAGNMLGQPGLVLAHTSVSEHRFPDKPFGSIHIHNLARETWAGAQVGAQQAVPVAGLFGVSASTIEVELRNKKRSAGVRTSASQMFGIEFMSSGGIDITFTQNYERPHRDLILDVLSQSPAPMTLKQLSAAIEEDTGRRVSTESLRTTFERGVDGVVENASRRPKTFSLVADED